MKTINAKRIFTAIFGLLCLVQGQGMFARLLTNSRRNKPTLFELSQTETTFLMFFSIVLWLGGLLFVINKKTHIAGLAVGTATFALGCIQMTDIYASFGDPFYFTDALQNMAIGLFAAYLGIESIKRKGPGTVSRPV
jgi:hypothetical protein